VAAGKVKLTVAAKLPLTEAGAAEAHDAVATGHTRGKIVLLP
jgi:NADPH:quinone reductase-like Zn-dependent oxidoreductase